MSEKKKRIKASDRIGTTVANLKILDLKRKEKRTYFYVECKLCGSRKWLRADGVLSGNNKSCGCLGESTQFEAGDLSGKKFGRLKALEPTKQRDKNNGSVIWRCECKCGNEKYASAGDLIRGSVSSCGCLKEEVQSVSGKKVGQNTLDYTLEGTNARNLTMKRREDNTSGHVGVVWDAERSKWKAQIRFKGKPYYLGRYEDKIYAIRARKDAEDALFGNFLKWFASEYPDRWQKMKKSRPES